MDRERDKGPQTIGDYEIVRTLGIGSFGKVKRESWSFRREITGRHGRI